MARSWAVVGLRLDKMVDEHRLECGGIITYGRDNVSERARCTCGWGAVVHTGALERNPGKVKWIGVEEA